MIEKSPNEKPDAAAVTSPSPPMRKSKDKWFQPMGGGKRVTWDEENLKRFSRGERRAISKSPLISKLISKTNSLRQTNGGGGGM